MLTMLGGNHHNTSFSAIERLQSGIADPATTLEALGQRLGPVVLLQTCNRFELYVSGAAAADRLISAVSEVTGVAAEDVATDLWLSRGVEAAEHLYAVASGIDSLSLGEYEVLGQVRGAFSLAVSAGTDDELLARVFHGAVRTGRRIRAETAISRNALSISSIAATQAAQALPALEDSAVLVVGAGEAGRLTARALHEHGARDITILNRTVERAWQVASTVEGRGAALDNLPAELARVDLAVSATASTSHIIDAELLAETVGRRSGRQLLMIDIAMPRDVDPSVVDLPSVRYWGIEDLRNTSERNAGQRAAALPEARAIVSEELEKLERWWSARDVIPTIKALTDHADAIREAQVERATRKMSLSPDDREQIDLMTRSIVKQLLHEPIAALRDGRAADADSDAVRKLFRLSCA
ncbi:MAG: glutamyl-tRNA reductase [Dehalococcoidia bacterium]|jgi:glutamyl-tRNA reductase|nr:glutamyl-tRNA reductase [Dehalococcoidia bacterium]